MAKAPPPPPPPPASKKGAKGNPYQAYINAHPKLKPYAQAIRQAAIAEGLDPVYYAALINIEYVPGPNGPRVSSAGAIGPAQVMPLHVGEYAPWLGRRLTLGDLKNPVTNIRFGAYYFSRQLAKYGSYDAAYRHGYNPGYTGPSPFATVPKGYVAGGNANLYSPQQRAQNAAEAATAKQTLGDPWVVVRNGKLKYVNSAAAPGSTVTYAGTPLTRSQFLQLWQQRLNPIYEAYTGKSANAQQAANILRTGMSDYKLELLLAKTPAFRGSPVWKSRAPDYIAIWHSVYGQSAKADQSLIGRAIVQNLTSEGFHELIRERPDYLGSSEFKQGLTSLQTVYQGIYGQADPNAANVIQQATLAGWSPDQFAAYLRKLPEYSKTPEYHTKALTFLDAMGLVTGRVATLQPGQTPPGQQTPLPSGVPTDPRVPAANQPTPSGPDLTPTL